MQRNRAKAAQPVQKDFSGQSMKTRSASQKHQQVRRDFTGQSMNSASQQRQQVRRDFTGQSIETPPVRAGKARTAKRKRNMDKHRKDNKAQESR